MTCEYDLVADQSERLQSPLASRLEILPHELSTLFMRNSRCCYFPNTCYVWSLHNTQPRSTMRILATVSST